MSDRILVASAVGVAVVLLGGGAFFFLVAGGSADKPATATPTPAPTPVAPPPPPPVAVAPPKPAPAPAYWPDTAIDAKRFDAEAFLPTALADARKRWKDATLVWLSVVDINADGLSDLTVGFDRAVSYAFRSAAAPPDAGPCMHWVYVGEKGVWSETTAQLSRLCALPRALLGKPRCTAKKAFATIAEKYPTSGRAKVLRWSFDRTNKGEDRAYWDVNGLPTLYQDAMTDMSWGFPDNCTS